MTRYAQGGSPGLCRACERLLAGGTMMTPNFERERRLVAEKHARQAAELAKVTHATPLLPPGTVRYTRVIDGQAFDVVWCQ